MLCASAVVDQIGGQNAPACGANVAANAHLTGDLSCPGAGPALSLQMFFENMDELFHAVHLFVNLVAQWQKLYAVFTQF